jgi:hypothetical protein
MWPAIRDSFVRFFMDKRFFQSKWDRWVNKVRATILGLGAAIAIPGGFGDSLKEIMPEKYVVYFGVVLMALGVFLRAGDKTPDNIKVLSNQIETDKPGGPTVPPLPTVAQP